MHVTEHIKSKSIVHLFNYYINSYLLHSEISRICSFLYMSCEWPENETWLGFEMQWFMGTSIGELKRRKSNTQFALKKCDYFVSENLNYF